MKAIHKNNLKKRASIVFRKLRIPIRRKVASIRKKKAESVTASLEKFCTANMFHRLLGKWRSSIVFIQLTLRPTIQVRQQRLKKFMMEWNEVELKLFRKRTAKSKKAKKKFVPIPENIRIFFISEFIKGRFRKYFHERQKVLESMKKHYYEARTTSAITGRTLPSIKYAMAMLPALNLTIAEDLYRKFISTAETNRLSWNKLDPKKNSVRPAAFPLISLDFEEDLSMPGTAEPKFRERRQALIPQSFN